MQKHNEDYIPTYAEQTRMAEERRMKWKTMPDVQKTYECKYEINGIPITEKITAVNIESAEEKLKQQCGMVGWIPAKLQIVATENTNVDVK